MNTPTSTPTPRPNDIWQLPCGRLADVIAVTPQPVVDEAFTEIDISGSVDFSTARLLYREDSETGDVVFMSSLQPPSPQPSTTAAVLVVGMRRFVKAPQPWWTAMGWRLTAMRRCPGVDRDNAPTAYQRLQSVGLTVDAPGVLAVDLLPPGEGWDEAAAVDSARYLRGVADGLNAAIVLLGRQVAVAFAAVDKRVEDVRPLRFADGYLLLPSPHARDSEAYVEGTDYCNRIAAAVRQMRDGG